MFRLTCCHASRVTIAHQPNNEVINDENYAANFPVDVKIDTSNQSLNDEQFNQLFATSAEWSNNLPVEDLTGEVQELMMRYKFIEKNFFLCVRSNI